MAKQQDEQELAVMFRYAESMQMFPPEVVRTRVKIEDFPAAIADNMGLPSRLLRTELEAKQAEESMQQQAHAMAEQGAQ